jgi:hypothetical protein
MPAKLIEDAGEPAKQAGIYWLTLLTAVILQ